MSQTRTAFEVTELLHLEFTCSKCHCINVFPLIQSDPLNQPGQAAFSQCLWCPDTSIKDHYHLIKGLINNLLSLEGNSALPLRLVFQSDPRNSK
jgi:hypothetical protein